MASKPATRQQRVAAIIISVSVMILIFAGAVVYAAQSKDFGPALLSILLPVGGGLVGIGVLVLLIFGARGRL